MAPDTLTGVCNFLMSSTNVRIAGSSALAAPIRGLTMAVGNWVGGKFSLSPTEFRFSSNKMNKLFQADASDVVISRSAIRAATKGKMMLFFATVDLDTDMGTFRVRSTPSGTRKLLAAFGVN